MAGQVVAGLLQNFRKHEDTEVYGIWMTSEEGVEEQREERDVRKTAEESGIDFRLWNDEKYFIDEYVLP